MFSRHGWRCIERIGEVQRQKDHQSVVMPIRIQIKFKQTLTATASALTPLSISSTQARSCSRERPVFSSWDRSWRTSRARSRKTVR